MIDAQSTHRRGLCTARRWCVHGSNHGHVSGAVGGKRGHLRVLLPRRLRPLDRQGPSVNGFCERESAFVGESVNDLFDYLFLVRHAQSR